MTPFICDIFISFLVGIIGGLLIGYMEILIGWKRQIKLIFNQLKLLQLRMDYQDKYYYNNFKLKELKTACEKNNKSKWE